MDETDFSVFGKKKNKKKEDKADATTTTGGTSQNTSRYPDEANKVIVSKPAEDDTYESCDYAGIALIFNHKDIKGQKTRTGTEKDRNAVARSLRQYGFDVRIYNDLTFEELSAVLHKVSKQDHSDNDCFVLVVMSHGAEGKVYAKDMAYPAERLWNPFLGDECKSLINKPKLFFIQACRGTNVEKPVEYSAEGEFRSMSRLAAEPSPEPKVFAIPSTADILVMYSTFEKHYSFRNVEDGSWFIQSLCKVLNEVAAYGNQEEGCELFRLLTAINRKVAYEYQSNVKTEALNNKKEMPNFMSTLTKTFYLRMKPLQ